MPLDLQVSTGGSVPIYKQIVEQLCRAVVHGELAVGDQLPSVRSLAERLLLNHNTVARAYNELARDGVIESRHGRGVFVARRRQVYTKAERSRRLDRAIETLLSEVLLLDFTPEEILAALERKLEEKAGQQAGRGGGR
jgi:GntR family transcriptional regulator